MQGWESEWGWGGGGGGGEKKIYEFQIQIFKFSDFQIFDFRFFLKVFSGNMLVRYRGINNKGVLDGPWTIWKALRAISSTYIEMSVYRKMLKS